MQDDPENTDKNVLRVITYLSKTLLPSQSRYDTHTKEMLAFITALKRLRTLLLYQPFLYLTDSRPVVGLLNPKKPMTMSNSMIGRWQFYASQFEFEVQHTPGVSQIMAMSDSLSRVKLPEEWVDDDDSIRICGANLAADNVADAPTVNATVDFDLCLEAVQAPVTEADCTFTLTVDTDSRASEPAGNLGNRPNTEAMAESPIAATECIELPFYHCDHGTLLKCFDVDTGDNETVETGIGTQTEPEFMDVNLKYRATYKGCPVRKGKSNVGDDDGVMPECYDSLLKQHNITLPADDDPNPDLKEINRALDVMSTYEFEALKTLQTMQNFNLTLTLLSR